MIKYFPNPAKLCEGLNPSACMRRYVKESMSVETAQVDTILTLAEIGKFYTAETPGLLLEAWLYNLNDFVNVQNKLKPEQITEIAWLVVGQYSFFNMADLTLIFKRVKMGYYGPLYGNLSGENLCRWFGEYARERANVHVKLEQQKALQNSLTCRQRSENILFGLLERFPDLREDLGNIGEKNSIKGIIAGGENE